MRRAICLLLAVWLCLPSFVFAAEQNEVNPPDRVNRALLVGCDRFLSQPETTPSSYNNVQQMAQALSGGILNLATLMTRPGGLSSSGDLAAMILDAFSDADADDVSIFYLSTHGVWEQGTSSSGMTLLLADGQRETALSAWQLRTMFDQILGKKVLIIDACHAGAMLGKGVNAQLNNVFRSPEYMVLCSSGGAEESWFWSGDIDGERLAGAGYFSGAQDIFPARWCGPSPPRAALARMTTGTGRSPSPSSSGTSWTTTAPLPCAPTRRAAISPSSPTIPKPMPGTAARR